MALAVGSAAAGAETALELDLPAQALSRSLKQVAEQFDLKIAFYNEFTDGLEARPLSGTYTPSGAFDALLDDTPLEYVYVVETTVAVRPRSVAATLREVREVGEVPMGTDTHAKQPTRRFATVGRVASALAAAFLAGLASAGEEENDGDDAEQGEVETVIVTGTRLPRPISGSPIRVLTREEMDARGIATIDDAVAALPQNFVSLNAASSLDNSGGIATVGMSTINLRGLGSRRTLVLVNGRRWVPSAISPNGTVNLNGIPFNAVERIEVLTDGASAVYGADAQAGIINFILRRNFGGGETSIHQSLGANGGDTLDVNQSLSLTWDGGKAMGTFGYRESEAVDRGKAGVTTYDFRPLGGSDQRDLFWSQPGLVAYGWPNFGTPWPRVALGALPPGDDGTGGIDGRLSRDNERRFDPATWEGTTAVGDGLTAHLHVDQALRKGAVELYGSLQYSEGSYYTTGRPVAGVYDVPYTNPYNDLPPDPQNPVVVGYVFEAETAAGLMPTTNYESMHESVTITLGAKSDLPFRDWSLDVSAGLGTGVSSFGVNLVNDELLAQRLAGVGADGNPLPLEQVINPFGDGTTQSPAALEGLVEIRTGGGYLSNFTNEVSQRDFLASLDGSLFNLPGGPSQFALGVQLRTVTRELTDWSSVGNLLLTQPRRDVRSGFAEWSFPLVSERNAMRGVHSLGVKLAARVDEYAFSGPFGGPDSRWREETFDSVSPKIDVVWHPVASLKVRAAWGESFVPPRASLLLSKTRGPYSSYHVDPERPDLGNQFAEIYYHGNPDLVPEVAQHVSFGFDWNPGGYLDGLSVSSTYVDTDLANEVAGTNTVRAPRVLFRVPGLVERRPDGSIARVNLKPVNLARLQSRSVDATISYRFQTGLGAFRVGVDGTYTDFVRRTILPGDVPIHLHGMDDGPERRKGRAFVSLSRGRATVNLGANYSSSYFHPDPTVPRDVDSYVTIDLTGSYTFWQSGWELLAGSRNVLDADFPFFNGFGAPWDSRRVDTRGRVFYLQVKKTYALF